ncbi:MAG: hypothetical protein M1838_004012 [Thelocarpon superellum]|nr:MAG: hypothetical protein M1838_004012 [Thelocarpon superellum]
MAQTSTTMELPNLTVPLPTAVIISRTSPGRDSLEATTPETDLHRVVSESLVPTHDELVSQIRTVVIVGTVASMTFLNSMLTGVLTVALPTIARDLALDANLLLWPASVYALTCGCTLLLSGSIADVVGSRLMYLIGCGLLVAFTLGCGLARTGIQLILFRACQGIAISCCLPSAVSIITNTFSTGQRRNISFACLGAAQPVGFSLGLVLGGIFVDSIGWRYGYYIAAVVNIVVFLGAMWGLPSDPRKAVPVTWNQLSKEIDWLGALLASTSLGLLSYVFAINTYDSMVTASVSRLGDRVNITLLCIAVALLPCFVVWVGRQERLGKAAIIPNSLWKNRVFTTICITVFFTWATFNAYQFFITLYFQNVQGLSAIATSVRFLPMVVAGCATNIGTGFLVNRVRANILVLVSGTLTALSPLLMALSHPAWSYWYAAFPATLLSPIGADVLFTVSNLLITSVFPSRTHGLAGGVFNTLSQIGNSVGLAITAIIASSVTMAAEGRSSLASGGKSDSTDALMKGYRATFWACFGAMCGMLLFSSWGLRRIGRVGLKRE